MVLISPQYKKIRSSSCHVHSIVYVVLKAPSSLQVVNGNDLMFIDGLKDILLYFCYACNLMWVWVQVLFALQ